MIKKRWKKGLAIVTGVIVLIVAAVAGIDVYKRQERILSLLLEHGSTSYLYNAQGQMTRKTEQIWQEADDLVEDVGWTANYIPQTEFARTSVTQYTYTGGLLTEEKLSLIHI